jgi:hypothetical protein
VFQVRVFGPDGAFIWNMEGMFGQGADRNDILKILPLLYPTDYKRLQKTGNSNFLKRRLRSFKFGFTIKKRYIYRKVYIKVLGIKIRIRKECLNCD